MARTSTPQAKVLVIHGPNLDLLGEREPDVYGKTTLRELDKRLKSLGRELGVVVETRQVSGEGAMIDLVHRARRGYAGLVVNPGGYTHTSVAIRDAIAAVRVPAIEVHLSNLYAREPLRHDSLTGGACRGVIMGFGVDSYLLALRQLAASLPAS